MRSSRHAESLLATFGAGVAEILLSFRCRCQATTAECASLLWPQVDVKAALSLVGSWGDCAHLCAIANGAAKLAV